MILFHWEDLKNANSASQYFYDKDSNEIDIDAKWTDLSINNGLILVK